MSHDDSGAVAATCAACVDGLLSDHLASVVVGLLVGLVFKFGPALLAQVTTFRGSSRGK